MIIGEKEKFAISVEFSEPGYYMMGFVRMWLNSQFVGSNKEEVMISSFVASLARITKWEAGAGECLCLGDFENDYQVIQSNDLVHDRCLGGLGEAFDDFEIFFYRCGEDIRFIWRLHEDPFHDYPGYGHGLRYADIAVIEIAHVLENLRAKVEK